MQREGVVFLFGEAGRGEFRTPLYLSSLSELIDRCGDPPSGSLGIPYGIQSLLFGRTLVFYRIEEEGFSVNDYMEGLKLLRKGEVARRITAICMPGVGDPEIIHATTPICLHLQSSLVVTEGDLYDYLTMLSI
jgi:hypothetical protein